MLYMQVGDSVLMLCAREGKLRCVEMLVERGVDLDDQNNVCFEFTYFRLLFIYLLGL